MPAQHPHPKLKGKTAKFAITVKDIKERVLPNADDEFAKDVGEFETLTALKEDIKKKLEAQSKEQSDNQLAEQLVLELVKANPVPVPPSRTPRESLSWVVTPTRASNCSTRPVRSARRKCARYCSRSSCRTVRTI